VIFARREVSGHHGQVPGSSEPRRRPDRVPDAHRKRVGAFIRKRRLELGLSQGDICRILQYRSRNAVSNIEVGIEGLPAKRAYAWADLLQLPRDDFFQFVTGGRTKMEPGGGPRLTDRHGKELSRAEQELVLGYRRLSVSYQHRLRQQLDEFLILDRRPDQKASKS
jgi:transcriptional regulator with XRE-family HTH domain